MAKKNQNATTLANGSNVVFIGCRLPHGLVIEDPTDASKKVELRGKNSSMIIGGQFGITEVDADFWAMWKTVHSEFPALKSQAIFEAGSAEDLNAVYDEVRNEATGFEALAPESHGVKTAEND